MTEYNFKIEGLREALDGAFADARFDLKVAEHCFEKETSRSNKMYLDSVKTVLNYLREIEETLDELEETLTVNNSK